MTESEEYFEILKIIGERPTIYRGKKTVEYLVLWKGYNPDQAGLKFIWIYVFFAQPRKTEYFE